MLVPGRFGSASVGAEVGEIEVRLTDGGNWQLQGRSAGEEDWRTLCRGHLDGSIFEFAQRQEPFVVGPLRIDPTTRSVEVKGKALRLAAREFDLLALLASNPERVFAKREILGVVWKDKPHQSLRAIHKHTCQLRRKLEAAGAAGFIVNCHSHGYRLCDSAT